ncbi:helix-turn-helix domain-containing protein [Desulfobulbus oligotrophicus]|uniref:Helix-turn-helix domain-containing protein n=1 Tax=Desulfobulbus oligotrophicus TaxID=1909699 RepID=A0A7T6ARA5_9BACT|nr:helix-turn-helix domain-containing protein [Desulfobulbus oligotrophicus]QQG66333.1 helix-turn-helix domain-containing protein [Desulfobulbus oligotrophicus]
MPKMEDDIKTGLASKNITQASIAKMLGVKPSSVHNVITGKRATPRIRQAVAMALGKPVEEVFPVTKEKA